MTIELLWLGEGGEISLDDGSIGFVGFVSVVGRRCVLCVVVKPQISGGCGLVWIHGL